MFVARIAMKVQARHRGAFREYVLSEVRVARELDGCVEYAFCEDLSDPARVLLYEEWATRDAFDAYRASALFATAGARLRPLLEGAPNSAYYESDDVFSSCAAR